MTPTELQRWLSAHGQPVTIDGNVGPQTRAAITAAFTNKTAPAISAGEIVAFASRLGCSEKQLRAVAKVESGGAAFDTEGKPKMLFERHLFWRMTNGKFGTQIFSNPQGGGYSIDSWEKLRQAAGHAPDIAFAAASWGRFQILGSHWKALKYPSSIDMAHSMVLSEAAHYEALARFIEANSLKHALAKISTNSVDNVPFASRYNGPAYARFDYHNKLARAMA